MRNKLEFFSLLFFGVFLVNLKMPNVPDVCVCECERKHTKKEKFRTFFLLYEHYLSNVAVVAEGEGEV